MRIAVIGAGIAGLTAAWALAQRHQVTLFAADPWLGGHAHTVAVDYPGHGRLAVDTGFIVLNDRTYPNFQALLDRLGVARVNTDMSFAVSLDDGALEYGSDNLLTLFGQKRNLGSPQHWRLLGEIVRFQRLANRHDGGDASLGAFLAQHGFSDHFVTAHLLPMGAAIWSMAANDVRDFPARSLIQFFRHHGLTRLRDPVQWQTIAGGSRTYVTKILAATPALVHPASPVTRLWREERGVRLQAAASEYRFSQAVLACHPDQALRLMVDATPAEQQVLGAIRYAENAVVLHRDLSLMPQRRHIWHSWNFIGRRQAGQMPVCTSYWMNRLQHLPATAPLFVTTNPLHAPHPELVFGRWRYAHPQFDAATIAAQAALATIQGHNRLWFCGAWCGYGFHEDGAASGLAVANGLGVKRPWTVTDISPAYAQTSRPPHDR